MSLANKTKRELLGGKAAALQELTEAGFNVPAFEVSPENVADVVRRIGFPIAVRSSATVEDGGECSFAGLFESYLHLTSLDQVEAAIADCHESLHQRGVAEYCSRVGVEFQTVQMHVIVQRMINPELAGVAFSVDPMSGESRVVIEACAGIGDDLLAGKADSLEETNPLLVKHRRCIEDLARAVQSFFGSPQDIEFAVGEGQVWLLQARPITRIQFAAEVGEWTNADFRDGGVSSTVCSPLMWSLYERIWADSLKQTLNEIHLKGRDFEAGRMFFGRPYWNVGAVKDRVAKIPGYVERDFDDDLGMEVTYEGEGFRRRTTLSSLLRAIPVIWGVSRFLRKQVRAAERLVKSGVPPIDRVGEAALVDCERGFSQLVHNDYVHLETAYFRTIFALSLAKLDFKLTFPDTNFSELVTGLPFLSHMAPEKWFTENSADVHAGGRDWKERFKHHCRFGVDVIHARWDEDEPFVELLRRQISSQNGGATDAMRKRDSADDRQDIPAEFRRGRGRRKLERLRRLIWLREELRNLSNRMYYYIRRCALEIGERRFIDDDVFFMTYAELIADDRSNIEQGRWIYHAFRDFAPPNEIGCRFEGSETRSAKDGTWKGIAAGRGVARGTARVVNSVEEALLVEPGAVLVCPYTEPGWTPALSRVSAVVTETGGLLSHAAVICREYNLPAVLAVPHATREITDGMCLEVNGMTGDVTLQKNSS